MPRKGENIYKRKDGRWEARYIHHYENGKAKYRSVYADSYTRVKARRNEELVKLENMRVYSVKQLGTLDDICILWLNSRKPKVKESTYTRYARIVNKYILPNYTIRKLTMIDTRAVNIFLNYLKTTLSDKTVSDIRCVFLSIWNYGKENGYPCRELNIPKEKSKSSHAITILPPETRKRFELAVLKYNNLVSLGIVFTMFTGIRIGELCGLKWGDIDFKNGYVKIQRTVERIADLDSHCKKTKVIISEPKTENSIRTIPLPKDLMNYIKEFKMCDNYYILTASPKHTEPQTYYSRYKTFLRQHDLGKFTFHELRHTFATQCVDMGFDIKSPASVFKCGNRYKPC